jgi:erythromycin esterase-like protein
VCIEGDFPHAQRVQRYLRGSSDPHAAAALADFQRFPQWMWRNGDVVQMLNRLRRLERPIGFYGLDIYSLHESIAAVLAHLGRVDPAEAERARSRYACFDHFGVDPQEYGLVTHTLGGATSCENEVVAQLVTMQSLSNEPRGEDEFAAVMNARLVQNAEAYYRTMFRGRVKSWNLRDTHMADMLDAVLEHLTLAGAPPKVIVWAHNSHVGDARATEMSSGGEINLGQILRERHGNEVRSIGFSTYEGTVTAASDWDEPAETMTVQPGLPGSYEELFHRVGIPSFFLDLNHLGEGSGGLRERRLQRAIGVIYRPESERFSHYFHAQLVDQFDAVVHFDRTTAVRPLERDGLHVEGEAPETYPSSL